MNNVIRRTFALGLVPGHDTVNNCKIVRFSGSAAEEFGDHIKLPIPDLNEFDEVDGFLIIEVFKGTRTANHLIYHRYELLR